MSGSSDCWRGVVLGAPGSLKEVSEGRGAPVMDSAYVQIATRLLAALLAGGMIGLERSHRGRQAGFREHTLSVCTPLIGVYDWHGGAIVAQAYDVSASRVIQGIMSGIGFLGAGGIIKEGLSVRGLTTAASIWMTASIGVLIGVGFYFPALITTLLTLSTLTLLRWLEGRVLHRHEVQLYLRQHRKVRFTNRLSVDPYGPRFFSLIRERLLCGGGALYRVQGCSGMLA